MATFTKLPSGKWRVQVRRKSRYRGETFILRKDAELWARRIEREIDPGQKPTRKKVERFRTFGDLIDLHRHDMKEVSKAIGSSKASSLERLKGRLGRVGLPDRERERLIEFGKDPC